MEEFRTPYRPPGSERRLGLKSRVLTAGSCFSDAIGQQLANHKFPVSPNPFGVVYNPISIHGLVLSASENRLPPAEGTVRRDEVFFNYHLHSSFSALSRADLESRIGRAVAAAHDFLRTADFLILTYGTAWAYRLRATGEVVANCHKQPGTLFEKVLLSTGDIVNSFRTLHASLTAARPGITIIVTVSPVRHIRDTLELNGVSKSVLRVACHQLAAEFDSVEYFPAWEIMMDDLRDYRFYEADLIHPNDQAEQYIWQRFAEQYMDDETRQFIAEWHAIRRALAHKPFHPASSGHQNFVRQTIRRLEQVRHLVDVSAELDALRMQLERST